VEFTLLSSLYHDLNSNDFNTASCHEGVGCSLIVKSEENSSDGLRIRHLESSTQ
jgi:hypothetical protein